MKYFQLLTGLVLGAGLVIGGSHAMALIEPQVDGHRTLAVETVEGKFLVVAGKSAKVSTREDLLNFWYIQAYDAMTTLNSIPTVVCNNPYQDQIDQVAETVANISSGISEVK